MGKLNFKDFNYSLIDSIKKGYKEILVTYKADNQVARQYVFIKESHGKGSSYYISKAKENIKKSIESGELNKASKKQIRKVKHTGSALKPVLITLAGVVAAGSLVTGGYYLGNYLNGGNGGGGGGVVTTGHTVVLLAGEGTFEGGKTYLIFNNVKDGTALGDIGGYQIPSKSDYDFKWTGPIVDFPYGTSFKINEDIVLTATFFEGVNYLKAQAIQDIATELQDIKDGYGELIDEELFALLEDIFDESKEAINKIEGSDDPTVSDDARNTINDLRKYAIDILTEAGAVAVMEEKTEALRVIKMIKNEYANSLSRIARETNTVKRAILTRIDSAYVQAMYDDPSPGILTSAYETFNNEIKDLDFEKPKDVLKARLLSYSGNAVIAASGFLESLTETETIIQNILSENDDVLTQLGEAVNPDDTVTIDWLGDIIRNKAYAELKYHYYDPKSEEDISYEEYVSIITQPLLTKAVSYAKGELTNKRDIVGINLDSSVVKALANVKILGKEDFENDFPTCDYFTKNIGTCNNQVKAAIIKALATGVPESDEVANKLTKCFNNALEAFSIWVGNKIDDKTGTGWSFNYLFAYSTGGKEMHGTVSDAIATAIDEETGDILYGEVLLDAYITLTEKAIDIAKAKEYDVEGKNPLDYTLLGYENGLELAIITSLKEAVRLNPDKFSNIDMKKYYAMVLPLINQAIEIGVDNNFNCVWSANIMFLPYIEETSANEYAIVSNDIANFLTTCQLGAWASTGTFFNKAKKNVPSAASYISTYYLDDICGKINNLASSDDIKECIKNQPSVVVNLAELINDLLVDSVADLYGIYKAPATSEQLETIRTSMVSIYNGTFGDIVDSIGAARSSKIPYQDSLYTTFFDTIREIFATIPTQGLNFDQILIGGKFLGQICAFFGQALDKANELKVAIEDNFIKVVSPKMSQEDFKLMLLATQEACEKIISGK